METTKIFLASSSILKEDRLAFEIGINRHNKRLIRKWIFLELEMWEDSLDAMSPTRLQDRYNEIIEKCDIFIMLFSTKVGKYTDEEFEVAFKAFKDNKRPIIYTYFKNENISTGSIVKEDIDSLFSFKEKLDRLGHFYTQYDNIEGLLYHFYGQLDKLIERGFIQKVTTNSKEELSYDKKEIKSKPSDKKYEYQEDPIDKASIIFVKERIKGNLENLIAYHELTQFQTPTIQDLKNLRKWRVDIYLDITKYFKSLKLEYLKDIENKISVVDPNYPSDYFKDIERCIRILEKNHNE